MAQTELIFAIVVAVTAAFTGYRYGLFSLFKGPVEATSEVIQKALVLNSQYMTEIEQCLKDRGVCERVEKTGSIHEDLNVDEVGDIQLETLVIRSIGEADMMVEKVDEKRDSALLRYLHGRKSSPEFDQVLSHILGRLIGTRYLDTEMTAKVLERESHDCISGSKKMKGKVKLNRKGSMLQMEVYPDSWLLSWETLLYTVEIVAAYELGEELYESRPVGITGDEIPSSTITWHRSFALHERRMLSDGAKMVLRVLKVLCKREFEIDNLTSYQLKTVVLHEIDANQDWSEIMLWKRLADVIKRLGKFLEEANMPHYFLRQINLLSNTPSITIINLRERVLSFPPDEGGLRRFLHKLES